MMLTLRNEFLRKIRLAQRNLQQWIIDGVMFILIFFLMTGLFSVASGGGFDAAGQLAFMLGYLTWRVAAGCIADTANAYAQEARWGILEKRWLLPINPQQIIVARAIVTLGMYLARVLIMGLIIGLVLRLPLFAAPFSNWITALFVFLVTILGAFGVAFAITGLHIRYKQFAALTFPVASLLLFFSGAMISLKNVPILGPLSHALPLSAGITLLRRLLVDHMPLEFLVSPAFYWLLATSFFYGSLGLILFRHNIRQARILGTLGHY